ncbi:MAG TPA: hypothetical protein PLX89_09035 [Verrucomicrobiota bacterium]|nr:hypothetical protein [Verrucomicrobiota bacterium]
MPTRKSSELVVGTTIPSANNLDRRLEVTNDAAKPLAIGLHVFTLVVTDNAGNVSQPARAEVIIRDTQAPTAVIRPSTQTISFGQDFILDGSGSVDIGGQITTYQWVLVQSPQ